MQQQQPQSNLKADINLKIDELEDVKCDKCQNIEFDSVVRFKRVSPLYTNNGKPAFVPVEIFVCSKCGHLNDDMDPFKKIIPPISTIVK